MVKILTTPREIIGFPREGLRWETLADQWSGMASRKSRKCCTVSDRFLQVASLAVLGGGDELKNWMLEQPVTTKCCSNIQFLLREFY